MSVKSSKNELLDQLFVFLSYINVKLFELVALIFSIAILFVVDYELALRDHYFLDVLVLVLELWGEILLLPQWIGLSFLFKLCPYGVNHGIEIYEDVVAYANEKLEQFLATSDALNELDFCTPSFVVGNCFQLKPSSRQYDRIYCGAASPGCTYEDMIKQYLKIGGILVMPVNDQLVKMTRVGEMKWNIKYILPVSFATLIVDTTEEKTHKLPDINPYSLQELCRHKIRKVLRNCIYDEHKELKLDSPRPASVVTKKEKHFYSNVFVPIAREGSNGEDLEDVHSLENIRVVRLRPKRILDRTRRVTSPRIQTNVTVEIKSVPRTSESSSESEISVGDWGIERENEVDDGIFNLVIRRNDGTKRNLGTVLNESESSTKRLAKTEGSESSSSSDYMDTDQEEIVTRDTPTSNNESAVEVELLENVETPSVPIFTVYMQEKLQALPLPMAIRVYLNLEREFKPI